MKRAGIEGIYVGGWATSAKGSADEDPGPDLASYPLSRVPDEAAGIVRALLTADKQPVPHARSHDRGAAQAPRPRSTSGPSSSPTPTPGHGGDAHVRNLVRRFVEAGVPGYHIEDQKPGAKKCGHQGGKVLVAEDEQIKRLSAARFQLDVMGVPGIIVARTDAESATLLDGRSDERDQPFILGATNLDAARASRPRFWPSCAPSASAGIEEMSGHELYATSESASTRSPTRGWRRAGCSRSSTRPSPSTSAGGKVAVDAALDKVFEPFVDLWQRRGEREDVRRGGRRRDALPARARACSSR